jgi:hypothetical protein
LYDTVNEFLNKVEVIDEKATPKHKTGLSDKPWDAGKYVKRLKKDGNASYFNKMFAWVDLDGDKDVKNSYKFPHHEVDTNGNIGLANKKGVQAAIAALNGARGGVDIPDADRKGVYNHLAKHLKDNDVEPAKLKDSMEYYDDNNIKEFSESINFDDSISEKIDYEKGIIKDVSLLSPISKNRRTYTKEVLEECVILAEGVKVFADHPENNETRSVKDLIGNVSNVYLEEGTNILRGDLFILKGWRENIFDMAENMPDGAGMSINASGVLKKGDNGFDVVEKILKIYSIDLVSEPATTNGLFEQEKDNKKDFEKGENKTKMEITLETLKKENSDILEQYRNEILEGLKINSLKENYNKMEESVKESKDKIKELTESLETAMKEIETLKEDKETISKEKSEIEEEMKEIKSKLDEYEVKEALAKKKALISEKIEEAELSDMWVTELFMETLMNTEDEEKIDALISERKSLMEATKTETTKEEMGKSKDVDKEINKGIKEEKEEEEKENTDNIFEQLDSVFFGTDDVDDDDEDDDGLETIDI